MPAERAPAALPVPGRRMWAPRRRPRRLAWTTLLSIALHAAVALPFLGYVLLEHGGGVERATLEALPEEGTVELVTKDEDLPKLPDVKLRVERAEELDVDSTAEYTEIEPGIWAPVRVDVAPTEIEDPMREDLSRRFRPRRDRRPPPPAENAEATSQPDPGTRETPESKGLPFQGPVLIRAPYSFDADYPRLAKSRGWEGFAVVEVLVDVNGDVKAVRVMNASERIFANAADRIVRKWKFRPARYRGDPVECWWMSPKINFRIPR